MDYKERIRSAVSDRETFVGLTLSAPAKKETSPWVRVRVRPVLVKGERVLQFSYFDGAKDVAKNCAVSDSGARLDELLALPFAHVELQTTAGDLHVRVTRKGKALVSEGKPASAGPPRLEHDRAKRRALSDDDPLWRALDLAGKDGRILPRARAKFTQVNEFLRLLDEALDEAGLHVAHPPSGEASSSAQPGAATLHQTALHQAKPAQPEYRRNLPHLQTSGKPLFVTFCTKDKWVLPESVRSMVLAHCLHDHGVKYVMHGLVVMPDHVHMVMTPMQDADGNVFGLAEIMNGIKGAASHSVNKALDRKGPVWQKESFDHVLRSDEDLRKKVEYVCLNPVRKGLVQNENDYPWLWREWIEGADLAHPPDVAHPPSGEAFPSSAQPGAATLHPQPGAAVPHQLRILDAGCGSAWLTFAAYHYINSACGLDARIVGVDANADLIGKCVARRDALGWKALDFHVGTIAAFEPDAPPDVVLSLHACDTATDEALARGALWQSRVILAAPCCQHELHGKLGTHTNFPPSAPPVDSALEENWCASLISFAPILRHGLLRERLADILTDAFRALALRVMGYRVQVVEFVAPEHTSKNLMLRAVRVREPGLPRRSNAKPGDADAAREFTELKRFWSVEPAIERLLGEPFRRLLR